MESGVRGGWGNRKFFIVFVIQVKNLRSSVAKKAVECLGHLFSTMKRAIEPVRCMQVSNMATSEPW